MFTVKNAKEQLLSQGESATLATPLQGESSTLPTPLLDEREDLEFTPTWTIELPQTTTSNLIQPPVKMETELEKPTPALYLKFEKHEVEHFGSLPTEVEELMRSAEVYDGILSWTTGYAAVQPLKRPDTVYKFQMPSCDGEPIDSDKLPLVCLIPSAEGSKPGLLACTPKGEFRYWEDISYAMTEAERYKGLKVYLQEGDQGIYLACHETKGSSRENCVIIFGTEHVALYRIQVCQPDGKPTLISSSISRPAGFIGQLSSYIWQSGKLDDGGIVSTTLGAKLGKNYSSELFVLLEKSLEKWILQGTRVAPKYKFCQDIHNIIAQEVYISDGVFESNPLDVQLLDIEFAKNGELVILVSHLPNSQQSESDQNKDLTYFLVVLNTIDQESSSGQYNVTRCIPLKVHSNVSLGPNAKLVMPNGGPGAFVVFPQAIIVTTILKDVNYTNIITMCDPINDIIVGFGAEGSKSWHPRDTTDDISEMLILTTKTGVMSCRLNISEIIEENAPLQSEQMDIEDSQAKRNRELKFTIEQAIFRKDDTNVPVFCTLPPDFKGDINKVVLEISDEILDSRSQYLDESIDLKSQLQERNNKMASLIQFIHNSKAVDKLHPSTRQRLFWNAEKMACVKKLWNHHNASYLPTQDGAEGLCRKLLNSAIHEYFQDRNFQPSPNEDLARFFYRFRVRDLGTIFTYIQRVIENYMDIDDRNLLVFEANTIILLAFEAAFDFRRMNKELYATTSNESKDSWTFQPELLKVLHQQFEDTDEAIRSFAVQHSSQTANDSLQYIGQDVNDYNKIPTKNTRIETLKDQMVNLADVLLGVTTERLICDDVRTRSNAQSYREKWSNILKKLVSIGRGDRAFALSESYEDYKTLVDLIMESGENIDDYIKIFMEKYQEKFAFKLYEWYLDEERYADLLSHPHVSEHKEWLRVFLNERNLGGISWMHDIYMDNYNDASIKLRLLTQNEKRVRKRKTFLSISKLTFLASLSDEMDTQNEDVQCNLEVIENGFELIDAYSVLQDQFVEIITSEDQTAVDEHKQVNVIVDNAAKNVKQYRPMHAKVFAQCVPYILHGEMLPTEGLIEVLTLKDKKEKDDFPFTLQFALSDDKLPDDRRRAILQTIWRRIYITDRWDCISNTNDMSDEDVNEQIKGTAVYHTLDIVSQTADIPLIQWFCPPAEAFFASTEEQLNRRFPEFNEEELVGLIEDYKKENTALEKVIQEYNLVMHVDHALKLLDLKSALDL
ncbi:nuclear pore protein [Gigaspora margarita]|uniref:Nuclear pore protein n=1 Tax=Gigaspora margarita TaxID=4874 RepID=A0A8H4ADC3_GIGMA|nr:nuclear pore protein [Gigaspora margarita]